MKKYSRIIFWTLSFLMLSILEIVFLVSVHVIRHRLGYLMRVHAISPALFPVFASVSLVLSSIICKSLGISDFSRTVEVFKRNPASASVTQSIELRSAPSQYGGLAVAFGVIGLAIALAFWHLPVAGPKIYGYAVAAFLGLLGALCLVGVVRRGDFIARMDADGFIGHLSSLPKPASWNEIATMEIATRKTPYSTIMNCTLKDDAGKTLTEFSSSSGVGDTEWKAFLEVLQSRFVPAEPFPPDSGPPPEGVWPPPPRRGKDG